MNRSVRRRTDLPVRFGYVGYSSSSSSMRPTISSSFLLLTIAGPFWIFIPFTLFVSLRYKHWAIDFLSQPFSYFTAGSAQNKFAYLPRSSPTQCLGLPLPSRPIDFFSISFRFPPFLFPCLSSSLLSPSLPLFLNLVHPFFLLLALSFSIVFFLPFSLSSSLSQPSSFFLYPSTPFYGRFYDIILTRWAPIEQYMNLELFKSISLLPCNISVPLDS